jgi:hypothetical protein
MNPNSKTRTWIVLGAAALIGGLGQFFTAVAALWAAVLTAILLPAILIAVGRFFEIEPAVWSPAAVSLFGILLAFAEAQREPRLWACPLVALLGMAAAVSLRRRYAQRCELCSGRLAGTIWFVCPRCGLRICEARCWDFERLRCRLCVQNRVPALPIDESWWDANFGARARQGRCQLCQAAAQEADLRNCARCGRPQCRECWDDSNGACSRCGWAPEALPETLKQFA